MAVTAMISTTVETENKNTTPWGTTKQKSKLQIYSVRKTPFQIDRYVCCSIDSNF